VATKFYLRRDASSLTTLPSSEQSTLAPDSNFFETDSSKNYRMSTTKSAVAQTSLAHNQTGDTGAHNYYCARWVSNKIDQTSIAANTWTVEYAASESNAAGNFPRNGAGVMYVCAYVWKPSNGTKYGNILDGNSVSDGEEAGTTQSVISYTFSGSSVSSLTAGDAVICFELWFQVTQGTSTARTATVFFDGTTENSTTNEAAFISTPETIALLPDISKSLSLKWNILGRISKALILKWNIIGRISKSLILKWNMLQRARQPSLLLDGSNDYLDCGNQATLWSQSLTKFSFSFWIYPTTSDATGRVMVEHGGGTAQGFRSSITGSTNSVVFNIYDSGAVLKQAFSVGITINTWNHIACVYDNSLGSQNVKIYVNKTVGGTTANLTEALNKSAILTLSESTTDFQGNIKDFRWFTTKALSQTEINNIYDNLTTAPTPNYWLKMNEGSSTPVDSIGSLTTSLPNGGTWDGKSPDGFTGARLVLKWNIIGRISKSLSLKWNVIARISKSLALKWNITTAVSKSLTLKWNILPDLARISKDLTLKWNVNARVSKSLILKWNILQQVSKSLILKWNVIARVSKPLTLKWNILGRISKSLILKWNVIGRVSKSLALKWNILNYVSKSLVLKWNVIERISKPLTLKWNILGRISKSLSLKWNIIGRVSKSLTLKWNVVGRISKDLTLIWVIMEPGLERISKSLILKWDITGRLSKPLTLKWNVTTAVSKSLTLKWNVLARVSKPLTLKWNVIARVSKSLVLKWNVIGRVSKSLSLKWNVIARVSKSLTLKWNMLQYVSKSLVLKWNVIARVSKPLVLKWHVIGRVSKPLVLKWNTIGRVSKVLILKWNILNHISKSLTLKWNVLNHISKSLILKWNILARVSKPLTLKWNVIIIPTTLVSKFKRWLFNEYSESDPAKE